jgi:serpin B
VATPGPGPRPVRDPARERRAAKSCNGFAYTMYSNAAPRDDFLFSPPSLAFALAMTTAGARGETRAELARALHSDDPEQVTGDYGALLAALSARPSETGAELDLASSIWVQQGISCRPEFLDLLGTRFGAATGEADFARSLASARVAINRWAVEQTHGRIADLLAEHDIDPLTRLVIASAAYLKDTWVRPFDPSVTRDEPFASPGGRIAVRMMHREGPFRFARYGHAQVLELPYRSGRSMLVLLPDPDIGLAEIERHLAEVYAGASNALSLRAVDVALPRWATTSSLDLVHALKAMGVTLAFRPGDADLSGMVEGMPLHVGKVLQKAWVRVDEAGTEAAAASAVTVEAESLATSVVRFHADHPFAYVIRDNVTGVALFAGRVSAPREP